MPQSESIPAGQNGKILCSSEHFTKIADHLPVLFDDQQLCDVTLISGDNKYTIMAHKIILISVSKIFKAMFCGSLSEVDSSKVTLHELDGHSLKLIINFIYKGIIELTTDTVESVLEGSHFLEIDALQKLCCIFMKENIDESNCLGILHFAKSHKLDDLHDTAMLYACKHFVAVSGEEEFCLQAIDQLCELISKDELRMSSEIDVFKSVLSWLNYKKDDRQQYLEKLLSYVRFPLLPPSFIGKIIGEVGESTEILRIVYNALLYHAVPDIRSTVFSPEQFRIRNLADVIVAIGGCGKSNTDLSVGLFYLELNEWIYTKWPGLLYPKGNVKYTVACNRLLIAGDLENNDYPNRVDVLNLKTFEWNETLGEFPLITASMNSLIELNGIVYAICDDCCYRIGGIYHDWTTSFTNTHFRKIGVHVTYENEIYFPFSYFHCTYDTLTDVFNMDKISRASQNQVLGVHIIRHSNSDYLIEVTTQIVYIYDLKTKSCVTQNPITPLESCMKTSLHGKNIIIYGKNKLYIYDVFRNCMRLLPRLKIETEEIDILLTNNNEM